ncbi:MULTISPECIES: DUF2867 domain-containing protein [unclassified Duganella]|uniref:DUF2867 domain-containing protein n=1 Tax=unclassified Duganella TaxID=2636909 RepID=UPI0006F2AE17|nr:MULTISPECIES: DUF2867 domain-containing protein [unclassified Duganella]KQV51272.1 hypothetical protein ASD07_10255 [Duganella sp. Root336D2]KRC02939.1 hypothetical protein ASE26_17205 [Duganella sp. Root198D2]
MHGAVTSGAAPAGSQASLLLPGAYFHDCYQIAAPDADICALELYLQVVGQTPGWVNRLMAVRNRLAGLVGLKNLGHLGALRTAKPLTGYRVGDRVGIFSLLYLSPDEVLLGDSDKHLDVVLSVCKAPQGAVSVTTVVHIHNWLGRLYMLPVAPLHKIIVKTMLKRTASLRLA